MTRWNNLENKGSVLWSLRSLYVGQFRLLDEPYRQHWFSWRCELLCASDWSTKQGEVHFLIYLWYLCSYRMILLECSVPLSREAKVEPPYSCFPSSSAVPLGCSAVEALLDFLHCKMYYCFEDWHLLSTVLRDAKCWQVTFIHGLHMISLK